MAHARKNIVVDQGADWDSGVLTAYGPDGSVLDLTGATLRGEVRSRAGTHYLDLTLTVVSAAAGTFRATLTGRETTDLGCNPDFGGDGEGVYDIEAETAGGAEYRLFSGSFRVTPEVTRETETS